MITMDRINISFTKEQYRTLLKLIYLGEWMHEAHQDGESKDVKDLVQLIFSKTKVAGTENMIEYAENLKMFFPTRDMEEIIHLLVDMYDERVFWEELAHRMAEKDFLVKHGKQQMTVERKFMLTQDMVEDYITEFEANGLDNIRIRKGI